MKNLLTAAALTLIAVSAIAAPPAAKKPVKVASFPTTCPITHEKIATLKDAAGGQTTYKGKTYYFCCSSCKPTFDKNPAKYAKAAAAPAKPTKTPAM